MKKKTLEEKIREEAEVRASVVGVTTASSPKKTVDEIENTLLEKEYYKQRLKKFQKKENNLSYDADNGILFFRGKKIPINPNNNQGELCRVLFSDKNKTWDLDEVLDKWGEDYESKISKRKVYDAGKQVNIKVAIEIGIKDLLFVKTLTTSINPKYLR